MTATEYLIDVLGGVSVFTGRAVPTSAELRERIKKGLPYRALESVRERLQLTVPEAISVLHMPARTLARRRQTRKLDERPIDLLDTDVGARQIEDVLGWIEHGVVS